MTVILQSPCQIVLSKAYTNLRAEARVLHRGWNFARDWVSGGS